LPRSILPLFAHASSKISGNALLAQKIANSSKQPAQVRSEPSQSAAVSDSAMGAKERALASPAVRRMALVNSDVDLAFC